MDGRTLLGALIRFFGFAAGVLQALQVLKGVVQLIGIAVAVSKQPAAQDAASAAVQEQIVPLLYAVILLGISIIIMKSGDAIAAWAYTPRKGRVLPTATVAAPAAKPARKPAVKDATPKSED